MKNSIFYQEGSGFSNREQSERLWSYLRCFSSMTREMTAAHRQDTLTDALLYYARKILMKTGDVHIIYSFLSDSLKSSYLFTLWSLIDVPPHILIFRKFSTRLKNRLHTSERTQSNQTKQRKRTIMVLLVESVKSILVVANSFCLIQICILCLSALAQARLTFKYCLRAPPKTHKQRKLRRSNGDITVWMQPLF